MDIRKLQRAIVDGLEDVKGQDIVVFNTEHLSPLFERVIIASGSSNRQTKSLAASVRDAVKAAGAPTPRVEGEGNGEWIIVDCGAAVVHVMQPAFREYYHLEELWGDKPVRLKLGVGARTAVVEAQTGDGEEAPARAAKKSSVRAAGAKKPRASSGVTSRERSPSAGKSGPSVRKSGPSAGKSGPSVKAPAGRGGAAKKSVKRTVGVKTRAGTSTAKTLPSRASGSSRPASAAAAPSRRTGSASSGGKKTPVRAAPRKG